jgi:type IV secretion system protein VirD4
VSAVALNSGANRVKPGHSKASLQRMKLVVTAVGVVAYMVFAIIASAYAASALVRLAWKQPLSSVEALSPTDIVTAWDATEGHSAARKKVLLLGGLPLLVFGLLIPFGVAASLQKNRPLHGAARFANRTEVAASGLLGDEGILLGKLGSQYLRLGGQQSVLLSAPTRSGKGVGVVIPNLLAWTGSAVVLDIKGENFAATAGFRAAHGQPVFCWAPFARDQRSHRWNPLSSIRNEARHAVGDTLAIAQMLYPTATHGSSSDSFFADQARNLFLGLVLLMLATPERPRTLGELLRLASGKGQPLHEYLHNVITQRHLDKRPLQDTCVDALNRFLSTSENTLTSILATLNAPLTLFADPLVDAATSGDDFDLKDLRRQAQTIYLVVPANRLAECTVLLNLFFAQTISQNTEDLPSQDPTLKVPCLLLLDEAAAIGRMAILSKAIGYLAGYGIRVLTVVQSISQLESVYGREDARTFATNHAAQILFAPREQRDANAYSEMLGTMTQRERSKGRSVSSGARGGSTSSSTNESSQRRPLLLPQEFKELGTDKQVIVLENHRPILADKIRYFEDEVFMQRLKTPPELPLIDLDRHIAKSENRVREARPDELIDPQDLVGDFSDLPQLKEGAQGPELLAWMGKFFGRVDELYVVSPEAGQGTQR